MFDQFIVMKKFLAAMTGTIVIIKFAKI